MTDKKKRQLGMNPSTASNRLVKDILWSLILETNKNSCYRCSKNMSRGNFSIEHKKPWLDSEDPVRMFFDLNNISFSHIKCNIESRRQSPHGTINSYKKGCRCALCTKANTEAKRREYSPEARRRKYIKNNF